MDTDRYLDCKHINFQTANLNTNAFSMSLKLANNQKNCMCNHAALRTSTETRKATHCSVHGLVREPFLLSLLCLTGFVAYSHGSKGKLEYCQVHNMYLAVRPQSIL